MKIILSLDEIKKDELFENASALFFNILFDGKDIGHAGRSMAHGVPIGHHANRCHYGGSAGHTGFGSGQANQLGKLLNQQQRQQQPADRRPA